jgi:hypothetical protein
MNTYSLSIKIYQPTMIVLKEYEFEKNMREDILKYGCHNSVKPIHASWIVI